MIKFSKITYENLINKLPLDSFNRIPFLAFNYKQMSRNLFHCKSLGLFQVLIWRYITEILLKYVLGINKKIKQNDVGYIWKKKPPKKLTDQESKLQPDQLIMNYRYKVTTWYQSEDVSQ